jgi:2-polyprenyl-6-methoxyphenol hydroxylase-like FAD-dependent oxidoreductase
MYEPNPSPHVLVSGGGIAGLGLALQLVRSGIRTTVVERATAPRPGGQAVDLRGASREVADRMGLMPGIDRRRVHEEGMAYVDGKGRVIGRMSTADFDGEGAVAEIEISRGDLAEVLLDALNAAADAAPGLLDLRFGDRITAIAQDADGVDVAFEHGVPARFDVVVGADGVHSATRRLAFGPEEQFATYLGGCAAFFTMPTPEGLEEGWFSMRFVPGVTFGIRPDFDPTTSKAILTLRMDRDPSLRGDRTAQEALIRHALDGRDGTRPQCSQRWGRHPTCTSTSSCASTPPTCRTAGSCCSATPRHADRR